MWVNGQLSVCILHSYFGLFSFCNPFFISTSRGMEAQTTISLIFHSQKKKKNSIGCKLWEDWAQQNSPSAAAMSLGCFCIVKSGRLPMKFKLLKYPWKNTGEDIASLTYVEDPWSIFSSRTGK